MSTVHTVSVRGLSGHLLTLTATATNGPPAIILTGGGDRDDRELRNRVRAALANSGQPDRHRRVEVHLNPPYAPPPAAAVAVAALAATSGTAALRLAGTAVLGEVGLDGSLRPTRGVLPAVQTARVHGIRRVIVPAATVAEAALVDGVDVLGAHCLADVADWLRGSEVALLRPGAPAVPVAEDMFAPARVLADPVLRAVEVAAAGGHHVLLDTPEDASTLLPARWLHHLLPDLTPAQQLEVAAIQSLTGPRENGAVLVSTPPMATIHHSGSLASLVGGAVPGAVSRAHHGLLVASDLNEFTGAALDALRVVLLQRESLLAHGGHPLRYPARLQLYATCTRAPRHRRPQVPVALLDAIDVQLRLTAPQAAMSQHPGVDDREQVGRILARTRTRVVDARARAAVRWGAVGADVEVTNATVPVEVLRTLPAPVEVTAPIHRALQAGALSRRGADTVWRLAWTAADLDGAEVPARQHVEEALALRQPPTPSTATQQEAQ